jgi:colicin D
MALTNTATSTLATATQPLAYVPPEPPQPIIAPTPPQQSPQTTGDTAHTLNPPPQPQHQQPPPQQVPPQPGGPPGPSTGTGGPDGSGGPGTQLLGSGPGQAPQAPPMPMPLDPRPPVPPPQPGNPPLRPPPVPSWASPQPPQSMQAAQNELKDLERLIQQHNSRPPDTSDWVAAESYNNEADYYNAWATQLHGKLDSWNTQYTPASPAKTANTPSWTQPAPQQPTPKGPSKTTETTPQLIDEVPLQSDLGQTERKYYHAKDFGVTEPRGRAGFDAFEKALKQVVDAPETLHIQGTYRGGPVILKYNPNSCLCVIQAPSGRFISGWKLSPGQAAYVLSEGALGGD